MPVDTSRVKNWLTREVGTNGQRTQRGAEIDAAFDENMEAKTAS